MRDVEGARTRDICVNVGRSDYHGGYYSGRYWLDSNDKQQERERVLDFMMEVADRSFGDVGFRLLSMPGLSWRFEEMILRSRPRSQVTGLEESSTIYLQSRRLIPGVPGAHEMANASLKERRVRYGRATVLYSRVANILPEPPRDKSNERYSIRSNRLVLMSADTYMTVFATDYGAPIGHKVSFARRFYYRNAVWLDYTSPLCETVESAIENILFCLEPPEGPYAVLGGYEKPIVITIMNARDKYKGDQSRVDRILSLQPALKYQKHWTYTGKGGVSMLTACFTAV